jgi:hypothetical protein
VIGEIELLWCSRKSRTNPKNNPSYLYYVIGEIDAHKQEKQLQTETSDLIDKLRDTYDKARKKQLDNDMLVTKLNMFLELENINHASCLDCERRHITLKNILESCQYD